MLQKKVVYISVLLLLVMLFAGCSVAPHSAQATSPDHITLTWSDDPRTTQTITWHSSVALVGQVQYIEEAKTHSFPDNAQLVNATLEKISTRLEEVAIYSVTLTGLKPATRYVYRIHSAHGWSELHTFTTAPDEVRPFKFLVFGDSQSINYNTWRATLQYAYQANHDAHFFTNIGDLVDVGQNYTEWKAWFAAGKGILTNIPIMPVSGNHENYTPDRHFSLPVLFTGQFKLPLNGPEGLKGRVYAFDYGDVHFVVLDTQQGEQKHVIPNMLAMQQTWLEQDLASTTKPWKIVLMHRPPYDNKTTRDNIAIRTAFVPLFDKYHVDLVFTGHDHVYARSYPLHADKIIDSYDKGTVYIATGRSGTKTYRTVSANSWNRVFYNPVDEPNYLVVQVGIESVTVKTFKQSGTLIDEFSLEKKTR